FGRKGRGRFVLISAFGIDLIHRHESNSTAALHRSGAVPLVGQEMLDGDEQKRTEPTLARIDLREVIFVEQPEEEFLGQIFGFSRVITAPPDISINWVPINAAEGFKGLARSEVASVARCQD